MLVFEDIRIEYKSQGLEAKEFFDLFAIFLCHLSDCNPPTFRDEPSSLH